MQRPDVCDAIGGATLVAANGLGRAGLGRIESAAKADLVGIDGSGSLVGVGVLPPEPLNNLLYTGGLSTRMVMTDGNLQVFDGEFVADDFAQVTRAGGEAGRSMWAALDAEGWFD